MDDVISDPMGTLCDIKRRSGKKLFGIFPAYFPRELVTAANALSTEVWGTGDPIASADSHLQSFACTLSRSSLEATLQAKDDTIDAFIFTSKCDNMLNLSEVYKSLPNPRPVHTFMIPFTSSRKQQVSFLKNELSRALKFLEDTCGKRVDEEALKNAADLHLKCLRIIRKMYEERMTGRNTNTNLPFYRLLKLYRILPPDVWLYLYERFRRDVTDIESRPGARRIVVSGMIPEPDGILEIMDNLNLMIAVDDLVYGYRSISKGVLKGLDGESLRSRVFEGSPCSTLYTDDTNRIDHILNLLGKSGSAGVVFWRLKFCELESFDRPQIEEALKEKGIPTLTLEVELSMKNLEGIATRVEAFCEMLE